MADDILDSTTNTKHNLDGEEDVKETYLIPRERLRLRQKIFRIRTQAPVNPIGINFDRYYSLGALDNSNLMFDATAPAIDVGMVLCPNNHLIEKYFNTEFINSTNTTATYDSVNSRYEIEDGQLVESEIVQFNTQKAFQQLTFVVNGNNVDLFDLSVDVGDNVWRPLSGNTINFVDTILFGDDFDGDLDYDLTGLAFPNKLKYRIENNTGSTKYINITDIRFIYH
jgi:hypothetical protein